MNLSKLLLTVILSIGLYSIATCQTKQFSDSQKLEDYLNVIHLKKGFNGEILVAKGETILFQKPVGLASYEHQVKLKKNAKYRIASITKTFTGTLIAIAQNEGKLNSQDKAIDYVKGLSPKFKAITIEQLANHTSGLPHNEGIKDYWKTKSKLQMTPKQVIAEINTLDLLFKPGSEMKYSSLGYYLLATILETVYNDNIEDVLKDKILNQLQMTETGVVDNLKIIPEMASGYHWVTDDSLVIAPYRNYSMLKGAGDMYSTASDLLKWNNSFFSNRFLSEKPNATQVLQQDNSGKNSEESYSNGWYINSATPRKQYHGGGTWGFSTYNAIYPDSQMSITILSNVSTLPISSIASDVEKIVFGQDFQLPSIEKAVSKDTVNLGLYDGKFISDSNKMLLSIIEKENHLYAQLAGNPPFEIYPKGNHQFFGKKVELEITFEKKNDLITGLKVERMGQNFHFNKDIK